jgi:hypothetical protein
VWGEFTVVQWRKRRWRCRTHDCARQTFTEQVVQVPAGMRTTTRLRAALAAAVEDGRGQSEVAAAHGVSWPTVQRAVLVHAVAELVEPEPTRVLGMDETRFGRPRWLPDGTHDDGRIQWVATPQNTRLQRGGSGSPPEASMSTTSEPESDVTLQRDGVETQHDQSAGGPMCPRRGAADRTV